MSLSGDTGPCVARFPGPDFKLLGLRGGRRRGHGSSAWLHKKERRRPLLSACDKTHAENELSRLATS